MFSISGKTAILGGAIAATVVAFAIMFALLTSANAAKDKAEIANKALLETNQANAATLKTLADAKIANDKIVAQLQIDVTAIKARGVSTRTVIREAAANDPTVNAWANSPVPDSVRDALNKK